MLNARGFSTIEQPAVDARTPVRSNSFGFTLGGPVVFPRFTTAATGPSSLNSIDALRSGVLLVTRHPPTLSRMATSANY
jgi:hypothetical protein